MQGQCYVNAGICFEGRGREGELAFATLKERDGVLFHALTTRGAGTFQIRLD